MHRFIARSCFNSIIHMSVFISIPSCFYYYRSIVELQVVRDGDGSSFIIQDCLGYPVLFFFSHMKLTIVLFRSVKNCVGILMEITRL